MGTEHLSFCDAISHFADGIFYFKPETRHKGLLDTLKGRSHEKDSIELFLNTKRMLVRENSYES